MSGCDRTSQRSDVSVSPTHARTHARGMRVYWVSPDARAQNGFSPRYACAAIHHREKTTNGWLGAFVQATTCVEGRRHSRGARGPGAGATAVIRVSTRLLRVDIGVSW